MASPQTKNGFTKISNELLEALYSIRIPGESMQVFLFILRQTYGYNRTKTTMPLRRFSEALPEMKKPSISRAIRKLTSINLIIVSNNANDLNPSYCINKNYATWRPLAKKLTPLAKKLTIVSKKANAISNNANATPLEPAPQAGCSDPKESIKDNIKDKRVFFAKTGQKTPGEIARDFFFQARNPESRNGVYHEHFELFENDYEDLMRFVEHWTERTMDGRREKWQLEKTFDLKLKIKGWRRIGKKHTVKDTDAELNAIAERIERKRAAKNAN